MSTMFRRKQRRNPNWLKLLFRRIGLMRYYRQKEMSWHDAWEISGRVL